jgi:hypothetical protein
MGRGGGGGIGLGIPGIGMGGGGMGRHGGGMGGPGGGRYPQDGSRSGDGGYSSTPPTVTVRWESALPVQQALLKSHDLDAPSIDEKHYAITVTGIPARLANNPQMSEKTLKGHAELKHSGKKIKPSDVRVLTRDEGLEIVYLFPRSHEIGEKEQDVEFEAHLGRYDLTQQFQPTEMVYNGKLEL